MSRSQVILGLLCSLAYFAYAAKPLFDPTKCSNGCQTDDQCPKNAHCSLLNDGGTCGFCICDDGFKNQGGKCNAIKGYSTTTTSTSTTSTSSTSTTTTTATSTTTTPGTTATTVPTTTGTTTQGPPPTPPPINCPDYDCAAAPPVQSGDDPLTIRSAVINSTNPACKRELVIQPRKCNLNGGGQCFGAYCLTVTTGNDYCICPYYRVDRQCAVDKPGSCAQATGQVQSGFTQLQGRRFRNPSNKDNGSIYGRHFASSMTDCIKLCQWTQGACRAVNFGQISGTSICELLSTAATEKNLLAPWLEKADGWQYAQVGQAT